MSGAGDIAGKEAYNNSCIRGIQYSAAILFLSNISEGTLRTLKQLPIQNNYAMSRAGDIAGKKAYNNSCIRGIQQSAAILFLATSPK